MPTPTTLDPGREPASTLLNQLIIACNDGARAQSAAARVVNSSRRARLEDSATRRITFVNELSELVRGFGGTPSDGGSTYEGFRAAAHRVRALVVGENGGDAYSTCARVEARAEHLYELAVDAALPGAAGLTVARQHAEVAADHAELRRFSMGG